jgi:uncharacterized small protein (DUF1192 family)
MIKRIAVVLVIASLQCMFAYSQDHYKIDFLTLFDNMPAVQTCEGAYKFMKERGTSYNKLSDAKTTLKQSIEELSAVQLEINQSMTSSAGPTMNAGDAKDLQKKLKNMSAEERRQWALQNYKNFSPGASAHVNRDINNAVVTEVAQYIAKLKESDMGSINAEVKIGEQIQKIEAKYQPKMEQESKDHDWGKYAGGEGGISPEQEKKYAREHEVYRQHMSALYTQEMNEKLAIYSASVKELKAKYGVAEKKIASTHYGDDAKETVNRAQIIQMHSFIAERVFGLIAQYEALYINVANNYTSLFELEHIESPDKE